MHRVQRGVRLGLAPGGRDPNPPKFVTEEVQRLGDEEEGLHRQLSSIEHIERVQDEAIEIHLERSRVAELEAVLAAPDLSKVRQCLVNLIEGIEVRGDDDVWMLVGEGPLGTDDLRLIPAAVEGSPGKETATGHERGARSRSLVSVVGATGIEPAGLPLRFATGFPAGTSSSLRGGPM